MSKSSPDPGKPQASTDTSSGESLEAPCPECGELVRRGLVRCWNCGAFMDPKIAATYQKMQRNPSPVIYSDAPEGETIDADETKALSIAGDDEGDEFELSTPGEQGSSLLDLPEDEPAETPAAEKPAPADEAAAPPSGEGDDLLAAALAEQREQGSRHRRLTGGARTANGFIIFCPYGCHVEVRDKHRGRVGRCPKCEAPFIVPADPPNYKKPQAAAKTKEKGREDQRLIGGKFQHWLRNLHVHIVNPEKLKLKAGSLTRDFQLYDVGFAKDEILLVSLAPKKTGLFSDRKQSDDDRRIALHEHLASGKSVEQAGVTDAISYPESRAGDLRVVQPAASRAESLFAGVPVFGDGMIAIQLPFRDDKDEFPRYMSCTLTQFRGISAALAEAYGIEGFGADVGVPLSDETIEHKCHLTEMTFQSLDDPEFYQADPSIALVPAGWQCEHCKATISEVAREKGNLGGKGGKGMAKAKCPKCEQKMGHHPLLGRAEVAGTPEPAGTE